MLQAADTLNVADVYHELRQQPYHGTLATQLLDAFVALPQALKMEHVPIQAERLLTLQEAICLWQEDAFVPPQRMIVEIQIEPIVHALRQVRPPRDAQAADNTVQERRQWLLNELWEDLTVPTQISLQLRKLHARQYSWPTPDRPMMIREPIFLYVYSGRRREGDIQSFIEEYLQQFSLPGRVLLIDLALSPKHDATNAALVTRLIQWFHAGVISGLVVAPPCETWTEARYQPITGERAPRPVRSADCPLGLQDLTKAELEQVQISTLLLYTAVRLLLAAVLTHTPGVMEHPKEPRLSDRPSIWRLPWTRALLRSNWLRLHLIRQSQFGGRSVKPTHLAVCHMSQFHEILHSHCVPVDNQRLITLQGKFSDGSWKTTAAKEYPAMLNKGLAHALVEHHRQRMANQVGFALEPSDLSRVFSEIYAGDVDFEQQYIQPDFAKIDRTIQLDFLD